MNVKNISKTNKLTKMSSPIHSDNDSDTESEYVPSELDSDDTDLSDDGDDDAEEVFVPAKRPAPTLSTDGAKQKRSPADLRLKKTEPAQPRK